MDNGILRATAGGELPERYCVQQCCSMLVSVVAKIQDTHVAAPHSKGNCHMRQAWDLIVQLTRMWY